MQKMQTGQQDHAWMLAGDLTKFGDHQQWDESKVLVRNQDSGSAIKFQQRIVVA